MITVFGSINVDLLMRVPAFPRPGETIRGEDVVIVPGGKGANQALAARRVESFRFLSKSGIAKQGQVIRRAIRA
jgi:sugar/nucleoside kinase (ribokinase family)